MTTPPVAPPAPPAAPSVVPPVRVDIAEKRGFAISGWPVLLVVLALVAVATVLLVIGLEALDAGDGGALEATLGGVIGFLALLGLSGFCVIQPGDTRVVTFFGAYIGTVRRTGLSWTVPLSGRRGVPVRVQNFETQTLKVNEKTGSPVQVSAIVVWQVADTAKAVFAVDAYDDFVATQSEAALRHVVATHPYDAQAQASVSDQTEAEIERSPQIVTLRENGNEVADELVVELNERIHIAGLEVLEVRLSNLSYAPEIAGAMLQRQQAQAVLDARQVMVTGAVSLVTEALSLLEQNGDIELDPERRAAMTSNLMTVLVGGGSATPVVNVGTLYN
ncbi:SPFH domain-containing protein [Nocardioides sp. zg-536]|uniref:SPFH domain-containing protein n=1 Tax=Nocardioides faecalis TaxID=2803858 RepID=A0A938XZI4_9ACTN|nr:SPFH domain-containing protein [Nocardioides faecalis]MBM9459091.1 SPFH domain-containing protein [Nocardioides faecalis]QVI57350.1 SPFH domain-containing protein [Nocardioides faecalis]